MENEWNQRRNPIPWSKQVHQKMQDVVKKKKPSDKLAVLHKLEDDLGVRWVYNNASQEKKAKEDLLLLWKFLIREVPNTAVCAYLDRPTFFKAIVAISRRYEFDLSRLTWNSELKPTVTTADQKLIVQHFDLLMETLEFCLSNLCKSGIYSSIIDFSSKMLSVNYFQFTKLSEMIADSIWSTDKHWDAKKKDRQLVLEIKSYSKPKPEKYEQPSKSLEIFERQAAYFAALETHKLAGPFKTTKPRQNWMKRFEEEGASFHKFLADLIAQVLFLFGDDKDKIDWMLMPHYYKLLCALVFQLKYKLDVFQWRKKQIHECVCMFLYNERLLNLFIKVLFSKTNVHDIGSAEAALDVLGDWFKISSTQHKQLPKDFDYEHFFAGVDILLDNDHHVVLAKTLILLYNNMELFLGKGRVTLLKKILLRKYFWRLFLHWNVDIRDLYTQLVIYKMVRVDGQHQFLDEKLTNIKREIKLDADLKNALDERIALIKKIVNWEKEREEFIQFVETTNKQSVIKDRGLTKKKGKGIRVLDPDLVDEALLAKEGEEKQPKGKKDGKEKDNKGKENKKEGKEKENKGKATTTTAPKGKPSPTSDKKTPETSTTKNNENKTQTKKGEKETLTSAKVNGGAKKGDATPATKGKGEKETTTAPKGNGGRKGDKEATPTPPKGTETPKDSPTVEEKKKDKKEKKKKKKTKVKIGKKEKEKEPAEGNEDNGLYIPDGLEVYGKIALYRYEIYLKEKQDFLRNPDKNEKGAIVFPAVKYQKLVMAGVRG